MGTPAPRHRSRRWLWVLLVVVVLVVLAAVLLRPGGGGGSSTAPPGGSTTPGSSSAPTSSTSKQPADCPDVQVMVLAGTYETNVGADPTMPVGLQKNVTDALAARFGADRVSYYFVPYPAQFSNPLPYQQSEQDGVTATKDAIAATANRCSLTDFALTGYSQGAAAAGDVAAAIGNGTGPVAADRVVGVGLIADPNRQPGQVEMPGTPVGGTGLGGARATGFGSLTDKTVTFCAPGDLVCDTPFNALAPQNLGATLAQLGSYLTSSVHTKYASYVVDGQGTTATQFLADYLAQRIDRVPPK